MCVCVRVCACVCVRLNEAIHTHTHCIQCSKPGVSLVEKSAHSDTRRHALTYAYILNESYSVLLSIENTFYREYILSIDLDERVILGARNHEI